MMFPVNRGTETVKGCKVNRRNRNENRDETTMNNVAIEIIQVLRGLHSISIPITDTYFVIRLIDNKNPELIVEAFKELQSKRLLNLCRLSGHPLFWLIKEDEWKKTSKQYRYMGIRNSDYLIMRQLQTRHNFPNDYNGVWMYGELVPFMMNNDIPFDFPENYKKQYKIYQKKKERGE